ncbi:MAG: type II toxin-antitoxin system RelB/DinJ family antitoxin [Staphylococcus equorum]|nr:type II toxin-antitoxin system RelB/DinJ family antitoxin [Staphylococcus equorum]
MSKSLKEKNENKVVQARINKELVDEAEDIFNDLGIDRSTAMRIFYQQVVWNNGLPFEMKRPEVPNEETIEAFNEDLTNAKRYTDLDELFKDLKE